MGEHGQRDVEVVVRVRAPGEPGVAAGTGSNEGFFAINSTGQVDYITSAAVPEPSTYAQAAVALLIAAFFIAKKRRKAQAQS
jgi:hypothetical protein